MPQSDEKRKQNPQTPRPVALSLNPDQIPDALKDIDQWVVWRYTWKDKDQKWDKPPLSAVNRRAASSTNPRTWAPYHEALGAYRAPGNDLNGIGFVHTPDLGLVGIDLDHCRNPDTGAIAAWAENIVAQIPTYWEVSPSRTGLRGWAYGSLPPHGRKRGTVEMYNGASLDGRPGGRYLTVTGEKLDVASAMIEHREAEILAVHGEIFGESPSDPRLREQGQRPDDVGHSGNGQPPTLPDGIILSKLFKARNHAKFEQLYCEGETNGYHSRSEADEALVCLFAFYTRDCAQIDRLFRQSALYRDDGWGRADYRARTIDKGLRLVTAQYSAPVVRDPEAEAFLRDEVRGQHDAMPAVERQEQVRDALSRAWGVPGLRMRKYTSGQYELCTTQGNRILGGIEAIDNPTLFRRALAELTDVMLPIYPPAKWQPYAQALLRACERVEVGPEGDHTETLRGYLVSYLDRRPVKRFEELGMDVFSLPDVFTKGGDIHFVQHAFYAWLQHRVENVSPLLKNIPTHLRRMGCLPASVTVTRYVERDPGWKPAAEYLKPEIYTAKGHTSRSTYIVPPDIAGEVHVTEKGGGKK